MDTVGSFQVIDEVGVTYRRLDRWCRLGIIHDVACSRGSGYPRSFERSEVRVIAFTNALADLGATGHVLAQAARQVRHHPEWDGDVLVSRNGHVVPRVEGVGVGRACWMVSLSALAPTALPLA